MIIILIGPPGSGKGTQGKILAAELSIPHISLGDIFRDIIKNNDEEAKLLNEYMSKGELIPSALVNQLVQKILLKNEFKKGCILDGYPRNINQAEFLKKIAKDSLKIIILKIDDNIVITRLLNRFSCTNCSEIYSANNKLVKMCDKCGGSNFINRNDDNEETIVRRLEIFNKETAPIIKYYQNANDILEVDATKTIDEISKELLEQLKKV